MPPISAARTAQMLAERIVNVARHPAALLFLGDHEAGRKRMNIALICDCQRLQAFLHGDVPPD